MKDKSPRYSSLPYDILHHICLAALDCRTNNDDHTGLFNLSLTEHRTREVSIPILFRHLSFQSKWLDISKEHLDDVIDAVRRNERILRAARKLTLRAFIYQCAVEEIPATLGQLLFELPRLNTLTVDLQFQKSIPLVDGLKMSSSRNADLAMLPSVQELTIRDNVWQFLARRCPNLQSLVVGTGTNWTLSTPLEIESLGRIQPRLKRLHCSEICNQNVLKELAKQLPLIEDLGFSGGYSRGFTEDSILNHIPHLAGLKKLKRLSLPDVANLGLGFNPPWCGTAYFTNPRLRETVAQNKKLAFNRLIQAVETHLATHPASLLQTISVGSPRNCIIYEVGEDRMLQQVTGDGR